MHTVKRWKHPECYLGATWEGWFSAGFGRSRDSNVLEESNFQVAYDALKPLNTDYEDETTVRIIHEGHWAVGWVEWIAIHNSNTAALAKARELCERANDYPILDESHFSDLEYNRAMEFWDNCFGIHLKQPSNKPNPRAETRRPRVSRRGYGN